MRGFQLVLPRWRNWLAGVKATLAELNRHDVIATFAVRGWRLGKGEQSAGLSETMLSGAAAVLLARRKADRGA